MMKMMLEWTGKSDAVTFFFCVVAYSLVETSKADQAKGSSWRDQDNVVTHGINSGYAPRIISSCRWMQTSATRRGGRGEARKGCKVVGPFRGGRSTKRQRLAFAGVRGKLTSYSQFVNAFFQHAQINDALHAFRGVAGRTA